jgi:hypothetical protein
LGTIRIYVIFSTAISMDRINCNNMSPRASDLRSSRILRRTDVSGQSIGNIFKSEGYFLKKETDRLPPDVGIGLSLYPA